MSKHHRNRELRQAIKVCRQLPPFILTAYGLAPNAIPTPEEWLESKEAALEIVRLHQTLPFKFRRILALRLWGGCSQKQIARMSGRTHQWVAWVESRALRRLAVGLRKRFCERG